MLYKSPSIKVIYTCTHSVGSLEMLLYSECQICEKKVTKLLSRSPVVASDNVSGKKSHCIVYICVHDPSGS